MIYILLVMAAIFAGGGYALLRLAETLNDGGFGIAALAWLLFFIAAVLVSGAAIFAFMQHVHFTVT